MAIIFLIIVIPLCLWNKQKIKLFLKTYKWLIILELIVMIGLVLFNMYDKTVILKEKDPHTNKTSKYPRLKEGETYTYYTTYYEKNEEESDFANIIQNRKEKANIIKIENVGISKVKILVDNIEKDYEYGKGFSYYSITSCMCGTPIVFEKRLTGIIKILILGISIIDVFILIFTKKQSRTNNMKIENI